jgi:uncharacterized membrane protein (DUF4010 family)
VLVVVAVVNADLLASLWIPFIVMFLSMLTGSFWLWYSHNEADNEPEIEVNNPLNLGMALKFGILLTVILMLATAMEEWFGDEGIYILSVISGFMEVNAITISLSQMAKDGLRMEVATAGIVLASATNTLVKGFLFAFIVGFKESRKLIALAFGSVALGLASVWLLM